MKTESKIVADHLEFFQAIDRIKVAGFIALETKRDQLFYKALNELNDILSESIKLIISNQNNYNKLFNAEWLLSSEFDLDYSEIFSIDDPKKFQAETSRKIREESLISRKSVKYGFYSLVSAISSLRNECLTFQRVDLVRTLNEGIIELLAKITESNFDDYEHVRFQNELRLLIDDMVNQNYDNENEKHIFLKNQGFYFWYMNCIYNTGFDIKRILKILDDQFFMSIKRAINSDENKVLDSLAGRLIDRVLLNSTNIEYNFIERRGWGAEGTRRELDEKLHKGLNSLREVNMEKEFEDKTQYFEEIWIEINPSITNDHRIEFENLKNHVAKSLKENFLFNHLRINIIHLLAYSLFKQKDNLVNVFLEYNQPIGNVSSYANKDILPVNLNEIKELGIRRYSIENRFYYLWDNHRDNEPYFNNMMVVLLARIYYFNRNNFTFQSITFRDDEEERSFQGFIEKLNQSRVENILNIEMYKVFTHEFITGFKEALNQMKLDIDIHLNDVWLDKPVSQVKIDEFKEEVSNSLSSYASLWNIYKSFDRITSQPNDSIDYRYIGINQLDPKGYFVEGGGGIYVNWPGTYSQLISENFEGFLGSEISKVAERKKCPKYKLLEQLEKEDLTNKIIISRNFRISFETFRDVEEFEPINYEEVSNEDNTGFAGVFKGADVYEVYTRSSQWESLLILDKEDMGRILQAIPDQDWMGTDQINGFEYFDVHGFAGNQALITEMIDEELAWMREMEEEEKVNKLKDSISIRHYQKLAFEQPKVTPIIYNF